MPNYTLDVVNIGYGLAATPAKIMETLPAVYQRKLKYIWYDAPPQHMK